MRNVVNSTRVSARNCEFNAGFYLQIKNPRKLFEKKKPQEDMQDIHVGIQSHFSAILSKFKNSQTTGSEILQEFPRMFSCT